MQNIFSDLLIVVCSAVNSVNTNIIQALSNERDFEVLDKYGVITVHSDSTFKRTKNPFVSSKFFMLSFNKKEEC